MSENDTHQIHEIQLPGYHTKREFFLSQNISHWNDLFIKYLKDSHDIRKKCISLPALQNICHKIMF